MPTLWQVLFGRSFNTAVTVLVTVKSDLRDTFFSLQKVHRQGSNGCPREDPHWREALHLQDLQLFLPQGCQDDIELFIETLTGSLVHSN